MTLSTQSFAAVTDLFHEIAGIRLGAHKQALVVGRLQRLAQRSGYDDLDRYVDEIVRRRTDDRELVRLVDVLTTNETYFFREPAHFELLARRASEHAGPAPFRVWSAASSSGEEAYSIAMVLADRIGEVGWEIVGTDLSSAMVQSARRGLYPLERARDLPQDYLRRFCRKGVGEHDGKLLVARALRERARFLQANLTQTLPQIGDFDVVFLRNVLIYFETEAKCEIVRRVASRLAPGGLLFTGHAESLSNLDTGLELVQTAVYARH